MTLAVLALLTMQAGPDLSAAATRAVEQQQCRLRDGKEIVVCGRRERNEAYRLGDRDAPFDPAGNQMSVMRERVRWSEGGESGIQSCGSIGPGAWTGCLVKMWERNRQQYAGGANKPKSRW